MTASKLYVALPKDQIIILGAGRNIKSELPAVMEYVNKEVRVLDWLLQAFSSLDESMFCFAGGYRASLVEKLYQDVHTYINQDWSTTGSVASLGRVPLGAKETVFICYGDVVFREETVAAMKAVPGEVVVAVDSLWRERFEARSRLDFTEAEKACWQQDGLSSIGSDIEPEVADGEFIGLFRVGTQAMRHLQMAFEQNVFSPRSTVPDLISYLKQSLPIKIYDVRGNWAELNAPQDLARFVLGTKAESLERLRPLVTKAVIGKQVALTKQQFSETPDDVINKVIATFGNRKIIVRSSALSEDSWSQSSAGAYQSILDVQGGDAGQISQAINQVFASYGDAVDGDQVLVQEMLSNIIASGVVLTRTPTQGAPYYVINYDNTSKRTDSVTAGDADSINSVYVMHGVNFPTVIPSEIRLIKEVIIELTGLVGHDSLDIEFAVTADQQVHVLQVRPIAIAEVGHKLSDDRLKSAVMDAREHFEDLQGSRPFLVGDSTLFSNMADWNPAEMIGSKPNQLALSLYKLLITDENWAIQRAEFGYRDVRPHPLLIDYLGHPYIDLRVDFNSFIPALLPDAAARKLVNYFLEVLKNNPEWHDKVEFEILPTCMTADFPEKLKGLSEAGLTVKECELLRQALTVMTARSIDQPKMMLAQLQSMQERFTTINASSLQPLEKAFYFLEDTRRWGIPLFSHEARHGFIAVSLLRSLVATEILTVTDVEEFMSSLRTVTSEMQEDIMQVNANKMIWNHFVEKYGHLRPGSYDITSQCYAENPDEYLKPLLKKLNAKEKSTGQSPWTMATKRKIKDALRAMNLEISAQQFESYLREAIEGRELSKFIFTRNLNGTLEALAQFGEKRGFSRQDLSYVPIDSLLDLRHVTGIDPNRALSQKIEFGHELEKIAQAVCLPPLIFDRDDFHCVRQLRAQPNFVTQKKVRASVLVLQDGRLPDVSLQGKIVAIPHADPGFDWVFGMGIAGLLTMYGGANSHMAIRVAEFKIPAAIGIGELMFEKINRAAVVEIDCSGQKISIIN